MFRHYKQGCSEHPGTRVSPSGERTPRSREPEAWAGTLSTCLVPPHCSPQRRLHFVPSPPTFVQDVLSDHILANSCSWETFYFCRSDGCEAVSHLSLRPLPTKSSTLSSLLATWVPSGRIASDRLLCYPLHLFFFFNVLFYF